MVEVLTGTDRSAGISYNELLDMDSRSVPDLLKQDAPLPPGSTKVSVHKYISKEYHDLEVERLWKRVWQLACHEDDIPNVGDTHVYDIAELSYLIIRTAKDQVKAFPNSCLHRGRALLDTSKQGLRALRCPFHGWSWNLDGSLKEVPCQWDFPDVNEEDYALPDVQTGHWGGFIFINPDPNAEPLEAFLGDIDDHFQSLPFERRYKAVHVAKRLPCNWKVAQEAFMESYHVVATHPTLLRSLGDANSKYDVFGNLSRAISAKDVPSPHIHSDETGEPFEDATVYSRHKHALTGHVYERLEEGRVKVTHPNGKTGIFDDRANYIEGEVKSADPQICNWFGGKVVQGMEADTPLPIGAVPIEEARRISADTAREGMRAVLGDEVDNVSDAELLDTLYYSVFPNISPWGCFNPIFYRFRPDGNNPEQSIHEVMFMLPVPKGAERPAPAEVHWLELDDDYTLAPQLGMLAKVFNQDQFNLAAVQKGLHSQPKKEVIFANYQETKIRHFHQTLDQWLEDGAAD
ncbi:MAG: aromatic ring-hydroxylating dioxygenase subunit alpha [Pseudomonadota bacterium]